MIRARSIAAALVALLALPTTPTAAAPSRTVTATTRASNGYAFPRPTVDAAWTVDADSGDRLRTTGFDLAGTVSTVTASWLGTRRADSQGHLIRLDHTYVYDALHEGATADIAVDFKLNGVWYSLLRIREDYVGTVGLLRKSVTERMVGRAPAVRGKTVTVRVNLVLRFPEPCFNIDDVFVVRSSVS